MFFRTSFLRSIGGWNERAIIWNDWELGIRVLRRGARVRWMKRPYHYINRHTESITGTGFSQRVEHILQTLSLVSNELRDNPGALKALQGRVVIVAGTLRREGDKNGAAHLLDFAQNLTTPPLSPALNMIYRLTAAGIPGMWRAVKSFKPHLEVRIIPTRIQ